MPDILHRIGIQGTDPATVHAALTSIDGLAGWWTENTTGSGETGGKLEFRFPPVGGFDMEVTQATPAAHLQWRVVDGPAEWIGTTIDWTLRQDDDWTIVLFRHAGWQEPVEFMHHCSTKWASYLLSLKSLIETGEGAPAPRDVQISDWH
jgi:uncharacterized protein YndB with AHSA1/START domain